jgi:hypothetical protein
MTAAEWFITGFGIATFTFCLILWREWEKEIKRAQEAHAQEEADHQTFRRIMDGRTPLHVVEIAARQHENKTFPGMEEENGEEKIRREPNQRGDG